MILRQPNNTQHILTIKHIKKIRIQPPTMWILTIKKLYFIPPIRRRHYLGRGIPGSAPGPRGFRSSCIGTPLEQPKRRTKTAFPAELDPLKAEVQPNTLW